MTQRQFISKSVASVKVYIDFKYTGCEVQKQSQSRTENRNESRNITFIASHRLLTSLTVQVLHFSAGNIYIWPLECS